MLPTIVRKRGSPPIGAQTPSRAQPNQDVPSRRVPTMNTFLLTSQIVCYGLSIVSASVNIARFVRHRRSKARRRVRAGLPIAAGAVTLPMR